MPLPCFADRLNRAEGTPMKTITAAGLAVTGLLITSTVASAQVLCVLPLMVSAAIVSANENRELTQKEAMWCGLYHDPDAAKKATTKKVAKKKAKAQ
jgi:hypothetical protein